MPAATDYDSIGIGLPRDWVTFPLEQAAFERMVAEMRDGWRQHDDWDRTSERRAELLLARVRSEMRNSGVRAAGMFVQLLERDEAETDQDDDSDVVMAAFTFGIHTRRDLGTELPLTLGNLATAVSAPARSSAEPMRINELEAPVMHELRDGYSIRLRRLYEHEGGGRVADRFYGESFLLPIGDDDEACGILQFVTTNLRLSQDFSELFVAIADTLTLWTPDQETAYDDRGAEEASATDDHEH